MQIVWDEPKRLANIERHGLDFADLSYEFFLSTLIRPAKKGRFQAIGTTADASVAVIYATLGTEGISIISMRAANTKERTLL